MYLAAIIVIGALLWLSIASAGNPNKRERATPAFIAALVIAVAYELVVVKLHPEWNIHIEFLLVPLFLVALAKIISPGKPPNEQAQSSRDASRCLTLTLITIVGWMIPGVSIWGIWLGHRALKGSLDRNDRAKATLGMTLGYAQLIAGLYLWYDVLSGSPI